MLESDVERTSVSSAIAGRTESSEEQPATPQSGLDVPGGGLGLALAVSHVELEPPETEHFTIILQHVDA